ncbi:MAG: flagellar hook-basal body complex protein, partial [Lachnospiraceae bacterium]|nr:flagellar hook-basal body complex protein [Lachnospiraceae bacterium]
MMRSLYSGVAGLKTHQTRMDVIGNNIANVNTTAYKSQSMTFSDLMYQTTQAASGANPTTGVGGVNARQIGLGSKTSAIKTAITSQGASQTTNDPFDIMITGSNFFVVSNGKENFFTRDGSFYVDGVGNLCMTSTGYNVMGWLTDEDPTSTTYGTVKQDIVKPLQIMSAKYMTYPPEATTKAELTGIVDSYDSNVANKNGKLVTLDFYDNLGFK